MAGPRNWPRSVGFRATTDADPAAVAPAIAINTGESIPMTSAILVHVGIAATDLDRSLRFWRDVLGLRVVEDRGDLVVLTDGAHNFTVFRYNGVRPAHVAGHPSYLHIGVKVADLADTLRQCTDLGVKVICDDVDECRPYDPADPPTRSFKVEDPDGIVVDVTASDDQWLGVTPQTMA
jgi:catechol 2,3-dioxygenase-like lactoylglutathione lyase family enzyme